MIHWEVRSASPFLRCVVLLSSRILSCQKDYAVEETWVCTLILREQRKEEKGWELNPGSMADAVEAKGHERLSIMPMDESEYVRQDSRMGRP